MVKNIIIYAIEALCLGIFMVVATLATAAMLCKSHFVNELPTSPIYQAIADPLLRRLLIGIVVGMTAISIIYSPWGKRSGAHLNPAVTLTFWRLKKLRTIDTVFYILSQCLGGICGMWIAGLLLGKTIADPAINYIVTVPGVAGKSIAFGAEFLLSLGLMTLVLQVSNRPRLSQLTGVFSGILVATYITLEAPLSGMSINPARSLASALPAGIWNGFWIYCIAPPLGMLLAAEIYFRNGKKKTKRQICCKLCPNDTTDCISPICCQTVNSK
jgi:aquaporin Z